MKLNVFANSITSTLNNNIKWRLIFLCECILLSSEIHFDFKYASTGLHLHVAWFNQLFMISLMQRWYAFMWILDRFRLTFDSFEFKWSHKFISLEVPPNTWVSTRWSWRLFARTNSWFRCVSLHVGGSMDAWGREPVFSPCGWRPSVAQQGTH